MLIDVDFFFSKGHLTTRLYDLMQLSLSRIMQTFPPIVSEIVQYATTKTPEQKSSHIFLQTLC